MIQFRVKSGRIALGGESALLFNLFDVRGRIAALVAVTIAAIHTSSKALAV